MEGNTTIARARKILKENFIGPDELKSIATKLGICYSGVQDTFTSVIPFSDEYLSTLNDEYLLILGVPNFKDQTPLSIVKMRNHFGWDPEIGEPCFYNQDWYFREKFANSCTIDKNWYLIRKSVCEDSRGLEVAKNALKLSHNALPSALLLTYVFFCVFFIQNRVLWENDYVWCDDTDHNGDRIYVGRYKDKQGINKNGFSIHRHLSITNEYGVIFFQI
jgi:hypothetical protein